MLAAAGMLASAISPSQSAEPPAPAAGSQGAFGLEIGSTIEQLSKNGVRVTPAGPPLLYMISSVPLPHAAFEGYILTISPTVGLCSVLGSGKGITTDSFGTTLRAEFDGLAEALKARYGNPTTKVDRVLPGSIWNQPRDFMMGMLQRERTLISLWERDKKSALPSTLQEIVLGARARQSDTASIALQYRFTNYKKCEAEVASAANKGL